MRRIETEAAQKVLLRAKKNRKKVKDTTGELIEKVLRGSHKTYRYILITALLAKSTNADIDALSLQAGDDSEGAYDARSLCHNESTILIALEVQMNLSLISQPGLQDYQKIMLLEEVMIWRY